MEVEQLAAEIIAILEEYITHVGQSDRINITGVVVKLQQLIEVEKNRALITALDWLQKRKPNTVDTMEPLYIVIDLDRSSTKSPCFWRPDSRSYTWDPFQAGLYTASMVKARWEHFNGEKNIAIPLTEEGMRSIGFTFKWDFGRVSELVNQRKASQHEKADKESRP